MSMFRDLPVEVGVVFEGERIRGLDAYIEFGGINVPIKFELAEVKPPEKITDGKIEIVGPDISALKENGSHPLGIYLEVAGEKLEKDLEGVIERNIHTFLNYIEGVMHIGSRYDIWVRLSRNSYKKGLNSFKQLGLVLCRLFKVQFPIIEKIQVTFLTDEKRIKELYDKAMKIYEERDARARGLQDEDVSEFYGCVMCQSFAPTHVCIITPSRISLCGAISWFDARAAVRINPKGFNFKVEKGKCLDPVKGEYSGINEKVKEESLGEVDRITLHSFTDHPHTACGCFEAVAFYIPEVDGIGIVHRGHSGQTVNGLSFSTIASEAGGGKQVEGLVGIAIEYLRSPKFFQADGGWNRVVWLPATVKERIKAAIPKELENKIPTENEVKTIDELKQFLEEHNHPVVVCWKAPAVPIAPAILANPTTTVGGANKGGVGIGIPGLIPSAAIPAEGLRILLKGVKIHVDKLIIKKAEEK